MAKTPKKDRRKLISEKKFRRNLLFIPLVALIIKIFIILRIEGFAWYQAGNGDLVRGLGELLDNNYIPPNAWYGADGENYIRGLQGLVNQGFFSDEDKLSYWPAGYPLLMWPIIELFRGYFFLVLAFLQSALYAASCAWLVDEIRKTNVAKASYLIALFLAFNPTLSLNTMSIGYELPVVALSLISVAALIRFFLNKKCKVLSGEIIIASVSFALATFMQPRLIVIAFAFFLIWGIAKFSLLFVSALLSLALGITAVAPAILIYRNYEVHGYTAISTNLGVTMRLGAGPETTGGYSNKPSGIVECPEFIGNAAERDNAIVRCVISWYAKNPTASLKLFVNKARFFWSPWFGPEANGTMARNPWNLNHPFRATVQSPEGSNLIYGVLGKFVSWIWMLAALFVLGMGSVYLWKLGDLERLLVLILTSGFVLNLISSMLTIGDHRFRIPSMGLSLILQALGLYAMMNKKMKMVRRAEPLVPWPISAKANPSRESP
jgi:hypothetical protein